MFKFCTNKSLPAVIHVRIRRRIVQIPVRNPIIRTIVPVPTETGKHAPYIPKTKTLKAFIGG
jgi:hypothetical protein